jgi:hypothetical protein
MTMIQVALQLHAIPKPKVIDHKRQTTSLRTLSDNDKAEVQPPTFETGGSNEKVSKTLPPMQSTYCKKQISFWAPDDIRPRSTDTGTYHLQMRISAPNNPVKRLLQVFRHRMCTNRSRGGLLQPGNVFLTPNNRINLNIRTSDTKREGYSQFPHRRKVPCSEGSEMKMHNIRIEPPNLAFPGGTVTIICIEIAKP